MCDKHRITEEPCDEKLSSTVLESGGSREGVADFNKECLHIGLRSDKTFKCSNCGWHGDADFNGSMNIAAIGAVVSMLRASRMLRKRGSDSLSCAINSENSGLLKAPAF